MLQVCRSRSLSRISGVVRRLSASASSIPPPKETFISPSTDVIADPMNPMSQKFFTFLKLGLVAAVTGATAAASYATYAFSLDEVDTKTKPFRASLGYAVEDNNSSSIDKFQKTLYTTAASAIDLYLDLRSKIEEQIRGFAEPSSDKLLPDLHPLEQHVFTLVLDLNETLIHSDWKRERGWRTFKRPGVDAFLEHVAKFYEIIVYSDQQSMYVDPILERLDPKGFIRYRLSRSSTNYHDGNHFRDLSKLNRDPAKIMYVSAHAKESSLQQENCVAVKPWKLEADDTALLDLIPFLEYVARHPPGDVRPVLACYEGRDIATEFIERSKEHHRRMLAQKQGSFWRR